MSTITTSGGPALTSGLMAILGADDIVPGTAPSYELCKLLWTVHPLGGKIVEKPVALAIGEKRKINVPGALEDELVAAFETEAEALCIDNHVRDVMHISRAYGAGAIAYGFPDLATDAILPDPFQLATRAGLFFNTYDPLNLSGSIVTNQNPNAIDFQKPSGEITAAGQPYHPSRTRTVFHGTPVYLDYQASSFSFSGRSIFLRALYPLKSFIDTMLMNALVARKAGLLVEKVKQNASIVDRVASLATGRKRNLLNQGENGMTISIGVDDSIESLNFQNIDGAMTTARDNIISDCAAATDVPAILLKDESFAKGLASGEQDMVAVVQTINGIRTQTAPIYAFLDKIVMYRAWNAEFFTALQAKYPDALKGLSYKAWFYETCALFKSSWPSLIKEPEGEKTERNAKKLDAVNKFLATVMPTLDPVNKANIMQWAVETVNDMPELFTTTMLFDMDALASYVPPTPDIGGAPGDDEGAGDADK